MGRLARRRVAVTIVAFLLLAPLTLMRALNSPRVQNRILQFASDHGPWQITVRSLDFSPWRARVRVTGLDMLQKETQNRIQVENFFIRFNPWLVTVAKLGIREIEGDKIVLDLSHGPPPFKDSKRLDWSRILLLKNLKISMARLDDITVLLPSSQQLRAQTMKLSFLPTLLRQIQLSLGIDKIEWQKDNRLGASLDRFALRGTTNVSKWQKSAPYINDIDGTLKIDDIQVGENTVNYLRTQIDYEDFRFELEKVDMLLNTKQLTGSGMVDLKKEQYATTIDIPDPIEIHIGGDDDGALSLDGSIKGRLHAEGEKFSLKEGKGKFELAITQVAEKSMPTQVPLEIAAKGSWDKGIMTLAPSTIKIEEGVIGASGKIDLDPMNMNLPLTLQRVPVAPVFGRFNDDSFHPIAGEASGSGTIRGWGRTFVVDGVADVADATYVPMVVERAHVTVKVTRDKLSLNGDIYQGGRVSGRCDMGITFTHQPGKGTDILKLTASLDRHNLAPTMKAFNWTGIATANYEINGPTGRYTATGKATITDGQFVSIPYKSVTTSVRMVPKQIVFETATFEIPRLPVTTFSQPLTLKFSPGMFTFDGKPTPQLSLRGKYRYVGKLWQMDELAYTDKQHPDWRVVVSGTSAAGNLNAHVRGTADTAFLNIMREVFRDASGPIAIDATVRGPTGNPAVTGTVTLKENSLLLRASPYRAENLQGTLRFTGHDVRFDNLRGNIEDGSFTMGGNARFERYGIGNFDLKLDGKDIRYAAMGGALRLEMDTGLTWTGNPRRSLLSGTMIIQNGLYTRNFNIFDKLTGSQTPLVLPPDSVESAATLGLDLRIHNNGEIRIRNSAADVTLSADIRVSGTEAKPYVVGIIQAEDGQLNYVGLKFNVARGLVEYRGDLDNPYIEFVGDRDIFSSGDQNYLVMLTLSGPLSNLKYDLSSNPPQDRSSLIALLMTGSTPEDLRGRTGVGPSGSQYAAGQVGAVLAGPLASALYLDTVRLESGTTTSLLSNTVSPSTTPSSQRLYLGKRLSDRLNLAFSTDVGGLNPQQSIVAEYTLTDYLLIKGGQSSNENFGFNFTLRFRERE